jgi:putative flavoprotein involved in K+ transport
LPISIFQTHSSAYRNPGKLPKGAVLVVGASQSGTQIVDELRRSGRKVYLSVGRATRVPRRYRGQDIMRWSQAMGLSERTVDAVSDPAVLTAPSPQLSGAHGGRSLDLHEFARDGVALAGRLVAVEGWRVAFAGDLHRNLEAIDASFLSTVKGIDAAIERHGWTAPAEPFVMLRNGYNQPGIDTLDLHQAGISSVVWATGYRPDHSALKLPAFDSAGSPRQRRGVSVVPGLYFMGLPWQHKAKSALMFGVDEDARHVVEHIPA